MSYPFLIQGSNIVVVIGNKSHTISKTHITYNKVLEAIKANDWDTVKAVIDPVKVVLNYGRGNVSVQGDKLFWKGAEFNGTLARRMIQMLEEGFTIEPMVNFMENLMTNPSKRAVTELYGFLEKNNLPITPDGYFLAYKKVRKDFLDIHSGTMSNAPGTVVEMERNAVDDDKDRTCSTGLHFCGMSYLGHFGDPSSRTVIVKINPRDVVSIPSDYNDAKGRACRYEVIGELGVEAEDAFTAPVQSNANGTTTVQAPVATPAEPKMSSKEFYRGYTDGFTGSKSNMTFYDKNYVAGYQIGSNDLEAGAPERYRYQPTVVFNTMPKPNPGAWPFPTKD